MACPNVATDEISMLKTARERTGAGYTSSFSITNPIYMSDLQRLTGGNASGSGNSYPAVNMSNPESNRPDGAVPLQFSEFSQYDQNPSRTAFRYNFSANNSSNACAASIPIGPYYHTDGNNLYPDNLTGIYYAYTTQSGTTPVASGYYQIYQSGGFGTPTGKWFFVNSEGAITGGAVC